MIRLAVDTAFEQLSMALIENNTTLARYHSADRRRNASILFQKLDELMVHAGIKPNAIDNFVINQGPGSYTGVRIGMSLINTLAQVFQKIFNCDSERQEISANKTQCSLHKHIPQRQMTPKFINLGF